MKLLVASVWIVLIAAAIAVGSCSVEHRSGDFTTCNQQADCPATQVCTNGLCIPPGVTDAGPGPGDGPKPDALICPSQCTSCKPDTMECKVDCAVSAATCNNAIKCPEGWNCEILCTTQNSCRNGIDCLVGESCNIVCKGQAACRNIVCGPGPCSTECSGLQSCRGVNCGESCACDVDCQDAATCENVLCTAIQCETFSGGCTSMIPSCDTCP